MLILTGGQPPYCSLLHHITSLLVFLKSFLHDGLATSLYLAPIHTAPPPPPPSILRTALAYQTKHVVSGISPPVLPPGLWSHYLLCISSAHPRTSSTLNK